MIRIRFSRILIGGVFLSLFGLLLAIKDSLLEAHSNGLIGYFASDAMTYFTAYEALYSDISAAESPDLFIVGSPILFMKLVGGNLLLIQLGQLALMFVSIKVGVDCFKTECGRIAFIIGTMIFPYFLFGFLSLNKEIYAMCATIFFVSYYLRGSLWHLLVALLLAMICRYYMLISFIALLVLVPRVGKPRYWLIVAMLIFISVTAPFSKTFIPGYSSDGLLDAPSNIGDISSKIIDSFGYAFFYPIKYLILIPLRAYSFFIDSDRVTNAMEGFVSIASLFTLLLATYVAILKKSNHPAVNKLVILGLVAPMPIMWSEIMHWRYYSYVYFFFLFSLILHFVDRPRKLASTSLD